MVQNRHFNGNRCGRLTTGSPSILKWKTDGIPRHGKFRAAMALGLLLLTSCRQQENRADAPPNAPPQRIVSLAPSITEILFAIGCGDRVVAVTSFCRYPPQAATRPSIGGYYDVNHELIFSLRPDLTLLTVEHETAARHLRALGLNCQTVDTSTLAGIMDAIRRTGALCRHTNQADLLRRDLQRQMREICERIPPETPPRTVLIAVGRDMGTGGLSDVCLAGNGTIYDEMLRMLRATNVFNGRLPYAQVGHEGILRMNPDVIIDLMPGTEQSYGLTDAQAQADWNVLDSVNAVRNGHVYALHGDYICIPGPRIVQTMRDLAQAIHPDIFKQNGARHAGTSDTNP